ncbi:caspase domain-containing protein [Mycena metata]|uniref:Caspase domain-containing protein n=1 Tax=Mycena metata TaxID=1033252 RepID=A0AAD7K7X3_9AGAR|nr:caspase domain-containing protein [Mycena metata]
MSQPVASDPAIADNVFALIIGIDEYEEKTDLPPLEGAVNDAKAFRDFLVAKPEPQHSSEKGGLGVLESNILLLCNGQATRKGILDAFKTHLLNNPRIPDDGDAAMIFFFAGHGTRVSASKSWISQDRNVEGICPVDERTSPGGKAVHTIPDYVLVHLLQQLSEKKGRNITAIYDSCHSGGMGREVGRARTANSDAFTIPGDLDLDLFANNGPEMSKGFWDSSAKTHVWLAGCDVNEAAREVSVNIAGVHTVRGRFTHGLIENLRQVDRGNTTFEELITRLGSWPTQTPCYGGERCNLLLFDTKYPSTGRSAMPVVEITGPRDSQRKFRIAMGKPAGVVAPAGVMSGTEFRVLDRDNHTVCILVAQTVEIEETILVLHSSADTGVVLPDNARAVVSDWKNDKMILRVFIPPRFAYLEALFPADSQSNSSDRAFVQEPRENAAHIALSIPEDGNSIVVTRIPPVFECERDARFPLPTEPALQLPNALNGIAHFNYFLERRHEGVLFGPGTLSLEVYRLKGERPRREPDLGFGNLVIDNKVSLKSDPASNYGIIIRNTTAYELFPYLLSFDATDYTINLLYEPHGTKAPLRSDSEELTVGMGSQRALKFGPLPQGMEKSSLFLKLFVATKAIDIAWIQQMISPFDAGFEARPRLKITREIHSDTWDAFRITVTVTK